VALKSAATVTLKVQDAGGGSQTSLGSAGVLTTAGGVAALETYVAYHVPNKPVLPAFSLPPSDMNKLRIAHGSCRKPHSFDLDALRTVDVLLTTTAHDPIARIHQLYMTGDQIYADDVSDPLLRMVTDAGDALLGLKEPLPWKRGLSGESGRGGYRNALYQRLTRRHQRLKRPVLQSNAGDPGPSCRRRPGAHGTRTSSIVTCTLPLTRVTSTNSIRSPSPSSSVHNGTSRFCRTDVTYESTDTHASTGKATKV
jgi:hypothetical protein